MSSKGSTPGVAELARLSKLIDSIYQGATEPDCWNAILPEIAEWVNADKSLLFTPLHPPEKGGFYFNHGIPESVMHLWATRWHGEDLMANTVVQRGLFVEGAVEIGENIVPYEQIRQAPIYRELNHPNGIDHFLGGVIFDFNSPNGLPTCMNFYRSEREGPFTPEERERLVIVLPHVSRAFAVMAKLREADVRIAANLAAFDRIASGVLLFNAQGAVIFASRAARRILEEEDGLQLRQLHGDSLPGELVAEDRDAQDALSSAILGAVSPDILNVEHFSRAVLVPRPSGLQEYTLNFSTLAAQNEFGGGEEAPRAIAFLADSAEPVRLDSELLKRTYGLTPAEIRIAETLTEGLTDKEMAERLGLSHHTVKSQLKSIFARTNTNSRSRLMRLLISLSQAT
jgi:DNA-binding CsgD family transcriptional regulator/PAS domain-containing protein